MTVDGLSNTSSSTAVSNASHVSNGICTLPPCHDSGMHMPACEWQQLATTTLPVCSGHLETDMVTLPDQLIERGHSTRADDSFALHRQGCCLRKSVSPDPVRSRRGLTSPAAQPSCFAFLPSPPCSAAVPQSDHRPQQCWPDALRDIQAGRRSRSRCRTESEAGAPLCASCCQQVSLRREGCIGLVVPSAGHVNQRRRMPSTCGSHICSDTPEQKSTEASTGSGNQAGLAVATPSEPWKTGDNEEGCLQHVLKPRCRSLSQRKEDVIRPGVVSFHQYTPHVTLNFDPQSACMRKAVRLIGPTNTPGQSTMLPQRCSLRW
uniref:Uncharacterized protein n=1 Tax=Toxoplasma gondii (strain ATCC 50861 / VEG) TaxID=432359 RepID=A0A0F7V598_TOXGV|nr:TPA: hypothetical protein BN1205_099575 [Toxoplasma gondii VEG]